MDKINIFLTLNRLNYYCVCGSFISSFCETNLSIRQKKKNKEKKSLNGIFDIPKAMGKKKQGKELCASILKMLSVI